MNQPARVMVVDDDEAMRMLMSNALEDSFAVQCVDSGTACLAAVAERRPDIVLLDVEMAELDGYDTCRQLKALGGDAPPVMFVSSHDRLADRLQGYEAGGDDYLCKPLEPAELIAKIERQLAAVAARRALGSQLDEAVGAVLSSADMVGEIGVVLSFQRGLSGCADYLALAHRLFEALGNYGLEGSLRVKGRLGAVSLNNRGHCTALESSILDHLAAQPVDPRIRPMGHNTSFNFGSVVLFVRDLQMARASGMDAALAERHGRAIDNVALLLEGAASRVAALDAGAAVQDLNSVRHLVGLTREALSEIAARNHAQAQDVRKALDRLSGDLEHSFVHLGLMHRQEEFLSELVKSYSAVVMDTLARSQETEAVLERVIEQLKTEP